MQLNAAVEPTPDIGTPRSCNGITLPPRRRHIASPPTLATIVIVPQPPPRLSYLFPFHIIHLFRSTKEVPGNRPISSEVLEISDITSRSSRIAQRRECPERVGGDRNPGSRAESTTQLSDDVPRRSTLSARTTRTPAATRDSIRANFVRPMKTETAPAFGVRSRLSFGSQNTCEKQRRLRIRAQNAQY